MHTSGSAMPDRRPRERELFQLGMARADIAAAMAACDLVLEEHRDASDALYRALIDSIIVSYARPFTRNKPVGPLPPEWSAFEHTIDSRTHEQLLALRHRTVAHSDYAVRKVYVLTDERETMFGVQQRVPALGIGVSSEILTTWSVAATRQLCDRLGSRLSERVEALIEELFGAAQIDAPVEIVP
jgi:hypothetical protein